MDGRSAIKRETEPEPTKAPDMSYIRAHSSRRLQNICKSELLPVRPHTYCCPSSFLHTTLIPILVIKDTAPPHLLPNSCLSHLCSWRELIRDCTGKKGKKQSKIKQNQRWKNFASPSFWSSKENAAICPELTAWSFPLKVDVALNLSTQSPPLDRSGFELHYIYPLEKAASSYQKHKFQNN